MQSSQSMILNNTIPTHLLAFSLCEEAVLLWLLVFAFVAHETAKDLLVLLVDVHRPTLFTLWI